MRWREKGHKSTAASGKITIVERKSLSELTYMMRISNEHRGI